MLLRVPNGVRYLIEDGERIIYSRTREHDDRDVSLFLLGSAWAGLCYQRGLIPLHASAVCVSDRVHAFTGRPGAGKSTLAAALSARGRAFFTDDVLILDPARLEREPLCFAGHKDLKLWRDAIGLTNASQGLPVRSVAGFDKHYATPSHESDAVSGRLASLTLLVEEKHGSTVVIAPIKGAATVGWLANSVYRPIYARAILGHKALYEGLAKLAGRITVQRFRRPMTATAFDAGVEHIGRWIDEYG